MAARPRMYPAHLPFWLLLLPAKLVNTERQFQLTTEECPLIPKCCEEDCCGPGTRWHAMTGYCQNDPSSPGFNGNYSDQWEYGCVRRVCCGITCCRDGMEYDESNGFCLPADVCTNDFSLIGDDILGEQESDQSGRSVSLSADGSIVAIGSPYAAGVNGWRVGHVHVFRWTGTIWEQLGNTILGEAEVDPEQLRNERESGFGTSVSLSNDGRTLAIGMDKYGMEHRYGGTGIARGQTRIFRWTGSDWMQLGDPINGERATDTSGRAVSLSGDGTMVAIGAPGHDGRGHVRVFWWNNQRWEQVGDAIDGEGSTDQSGFSVSLVSQNGKHVLAIGAPTANRASDRYGFAGQTRVFQWNSSMERWDQLGSDIDGEGYADQSGFSVSLSNDGQIVATGASIQYNARIFQFNGTEWNKLGNSIVDEQNGKSSGAVTLSGDGFVVAIGDSYCAQRKGQVRIFQYDGERWVQLRNSMDGVAAGVEFGGAVALSEDGGIVAGGARLYGPSQGSVQVFSCN